MATSVSLAALDGILGGAWWAQVVLIAGVTAVVGALRFVALRLWVFPEHAHRPLAQPA